MTTLFVSALLTMAATASGAIAALPSSPFALSVIPSRPAAGQAVTLRVLPRGGTGRHDLYIMWATGERAAFLTRDGRWSPRPVPWLRGVAAASGETMTWRGMAPGPPGEVPLALVIVAPGADPLDRTQWQARPALTSMRAPGEPPRHAPDAGIIAPLVGAAALAIALVLLGPSCRAPSGRWVRLDIGRLVRRRDKKRSTVTRPA